MNIDALILHFKRAFQPQIRAGADAINNGDEKALTGVLDTLADNSFVRSVTAKLSAARAEGEKLREKLKTMGLFGELIYGCSFVAGGALFLGSCKVIAIILLIIGAAMLLHATWNLFIKPFLDKFFASANSVVS